MAQAERGRAPKWRDQASGGEGYSTHTEDEEKLDEHGTEGQDPSHENAVAGRKS